MKYFKVIIIFSLLAIISACSTCNPEGTYYCYNDDTAVNYLIIKDDGTYLHCFEKAGSKLSCKGIWKKDDSDNCMIELYDWEDYNERGVDYYTYAVSILYIDGKYLNITPDGKDFDSFIKEDE